MTQTCLGKVALVTGGSRGIGAAVVHRLAKDGADIVFSYGSSKEQADQVVREVEARGRRAVAIKADQAVASEVDALVKAAHGAFNRLDILVNSAGVFVTGVAGDPAADLVAFDRIDPMDISPLKYLP
jgi:3-oxoacyl-[acyl-carrier protein] reductase